MKVYKEGNQVIIDKGSPFELIAINEVDAIVLDWEGDCVGIHDKETNFSYKEDWMNITDKSGVQLGDNKQEVIDELSYIIGSIKYEQKWDDIPINISNVWVTVQLPDAPKNRVVGISIRATKNNIDAGVRRVPSPLYPDTPQREVGMFLKETNFMTCITNSNGEIQLYTTDANKTEFKLESIIR